MHLAITKLVVVRQDVPAGTDGGMTVGQLIDAHIADAMKDGERVGNIEVAISDEDWNLWNGGGIVADHPPGTFAGKKRPNPNGRPLTTS